MVDLFTISTEFLSVLINSAVTASKSLKIRQHLYMDYQNDNVRVDKLLVLL